MEQLERYRTANGPGCLRTLAALSNGALSEETIRGLLARRKYHISVWRLLGTTLDAAKGYENG